MIKNKDIQIVIFGHKDIDYDYWDDELYTPLLVGAELNDAPSIKLKDNLGDNISAWNGIYAETSGLYWLYRQIDGAKGKGNNTDGAKGKGNNTDGAKGKGSKTDEPIEYEGYEGLNFKNLKYIGQCQYRRRLYFSSDTDFKKLFKDYDIIVAKPLIFGMSVERQYGICHNLEDIQFTEDIVKELYPTYSEDWDKYIKQEGKIYYSSGMIMKKKDYIDYCKWLFPIFDEFKKRKGFKKPSDVEKYVDNNIKLKKHRDTLGLKYQMQLFGFLQERLFTLYLKHNFDKILEVDYKKYEGV